MGPIAPTQSAQPQPHVKVLDQDSAKLRKAVNPDRIFQHLRELQVVADRYGDRAAGQEGYHASSRYLESELREAGYQPRRRWLDFTYTRVNTNTFIADGEQIDNHVLTGSPSTPVGGITSELVAPTNPLGCVAADWAGADVTGKIALVNRGTCPFADKSRAAYAAGAVGVVIWNNVAGPFTGGTLGPTTPDLVPTTGIT